ncbi:MAG: 1-acyl-sn-glycerol-3-phosphate acyltransferase [Oscillospiraceae bacterium]|nr:1-acyl-sn-glycerol-3-phosphate acyltransferase [Oscillospiraceae bacterium]
MEATNKLSIPKTALYTFLRPFCWLMYTVIFPLRVINRDGLKHLKAPYILIANHNSALDPGVLGLLCPYELRCLGKKELIKNKLSSWLLEKQLHMIPVARHSFDLQAMRSCIQTLKAGHVLCIFPEGTRKLENLMEKVEKGVALLAMRQKADLIPVYIDGKLRPFHINRVIVGDPIRASEFPAGAYSEQNADKLCNTIKNRFYYLRDRLHKLAALQSDR